MKKFFDRILNVDVADPEDSRKRRLLNTLLLGIFVVVILNIVTVFLYPEMMGNSGVQFLLLGIAVFFIGIILIYWINRYSGKWAAFLFLLLLTLTVNLTDTPAELSNGRSIFVYTFPIIISSLILFSSASFVFATISSICMVGLAWSISGIPNWLAIIGFYMLALVSWLTTRSLEQALGDLRSINTNLDKIVTERTQALADALTRERIEAGRNQAILNSIADGVIVFNAENAAILANPALSGLTATPFENLTGISLNEFVQTAELSPSNQKAITELIEHPDKTESGIRVEWGNKSLSMGVARVQDTATKESIGAVAVFRDVTREAELEKMKENFVAIVSHELRTPLNALMGLTEMLQEGIYGYLNEKQVSIIDRLMTNITRLLGMVGDLLDEAQIGAGKLSIKPQVFKTASLLENLHNTMDKIAADKGLALSTELDPNMPENIKGDPQRLQQVLLNLVNNAVKFTEKGGVRVHIACAEQDRWKMEVSDTGIGISEKEVPYIFESFRQASNAKMTTRQHGGFGLGLSIVKQLVELMNGSIHVKSESERGSMFTILLPLEID